MIEINLKNKLPNKDFNNIDELTNFYYDDLLNPICKTRKKSSNLIDRLDKRSSLIYEIHKKSKESNSLSEFYEFILDEKNNSTLLKDIIVSTPDILEDKIIPKIETFCKSKCILNFNPNEQNKNKEIEDVLKTFGYNNLRSNHVGEWLSKQLSINVCPYCNRQYTFTININNKITQLLFDFDHFLSKSRYPYLSLSFFNLIPSCSLCNSRFKLNREFMLEQNIHPHISGFNPEVTFTINPSKASFVERMLHKEDYKIKLKNIDIEEEPGSFKYLKERNTNDIFKLEEVYDNHRDYVNELIQKFYSYNDDIIKHIYENNKEIFSNEDEVRFMAFGNYIEEGDLDKRPLAKLTRDIFNELTNLKNGIVK